MFGFPGSDQVFRTSRGSCPSSPLANVAFNATMVHGLKELDEALHVLTPLQPPVAWVDDVAIPIVAQTCSPLEPLLSGSS